MPRSIQEGRFRARATQPHFVTLPTEIPIPDAERNVVPDIEAPKLRWHVCTTAPQSERRAAESLRREAPRLARIGLPPLVAYVPCATDWRERKRGGTTLPRLEVQTPKIRSYVFVGAQGGLTAAHLGVMAERERGVLGREGPNRHGLLAILGRIVAVEGGKPKPHVLKLPNDEVSTIAEWAAQERRDAEATSYRQFLARQAEARQESASAKQTAFFDVGDRVEVESGPFATYTGEVEGMDDVNQRALISIDIFGRPTPIELDFKDLLRVAEAA